MYSEAEIESAVQSGRLSREAADALRQHVSDLRATPAADEEQLRLITSFNDVFVALAGMLVLVAAGWLADAAGPVAAGLSVAAVAWGLAEYFTRQRRMALPSIVFFLAFVWGVGAAANALLGGVGPGTIAFGGTYLRQNVSPMLFVMAAAAQAVSFAAIWLHWKRFMVPISVAAAVGSIVVLAFSLVLAAFPDPGRWILFVTLAAGLAVFAIAMRWDMQDRERKTRRSDVAFWLHLLASPLIVHSIFVLLGLNFIDDRPQPGDGSVALLAVVAILLYFAFGLVALIVDRRAFLVSALIYVLAATVYLVSRTNMEGAGIAIAALVIGSGLLMLSALWQRLRAALVSRLPLDWQARLPAIYRDGMPAAA